MESINIERDIENILKQIKTPGFQKEIRDYLFIRERIDKVKIRTRRNDVQALLSLDKFLVDNKLGYKTITRDHMLEAESYFEKTLKLSKVSLQLYEIHIKRFYKYLSNKDEYKKGKRFQKNIPYPDSVSWISSIQSNGNNLPLGKTLDFDGLTRMLNVCDNIRDQAMIIMFADAGLRNSELISLNYENLDFDKLGAYITIREHSTADLKTGERKIRLFLVPSSTQYLKEFANKHPFKKYGKAPLFYSRDVHYYSDLVTKANQGTITDEDFEKLRLHRLSVKDIIKRIGKQADVPIRKPHDLRHNSCTWCVKAGFNEAELRIRYGWSSTSKMPSRYTHLASKDIDDKIKIITGFKEPDKPESDILQPVICWNCKEENLPTNKFCSLCGNNLKPTKEELAETVTVTEATETLAKMTSGELEELIGNILLKKLKEKH